MGQQAQQGWVVGIQVLVPRRPPTQQACQGAAGAAGQMGKGALSRQSRRQGQEEGRGESHRVNADLTFVGTSLNLLWPHPSAVLNWVTSCT
jgi:hypothetical protein